MTRYSRSVIPGRADESDSASLDRAVFGAKRRPVAAPANDRGDYSDPMEMDVDEAGHLVDRSEQRKSGERRKSGDRRTPDFPPLRDNAAAYRAADDGKRGPILLVGALVIVAVFGVVVWSAYRDGVKTDDPEAAAPQLATAGSFKTPPREVKDAPIAGGQPIDVAEQLEGGPAPVTETRAEPAPAPVVAAPKVETAAVVPASPKVTAAPPAPLKTPAPAPVPVQQATAKPVEIAKATVAPSPKPASPPVELPKPTAPTPAAAAPAPAPQTAAFKPAFVAGGNYVVQIAAPSTEASAIAEWDKRAKALPEFFSGAERFIVQADVNGKTVYRLRAGPFGSKADADAFCSAFKAKGGNCFPATK